MSDDVRRQLAAVVPKGLPGVKLTIPQLMNAAIAEVGLPTAAEYVSERWAYEVLDVIGRAAARGQKACLNAMVRLMSWGPQRHKSRARPSERIGVRLEAEAPRAAKFERECRSVGVGQAAEKACEVLRDYLLKHPASRNRIRAEIGL
jgi:hypothetical protein